jgi:excinuclease UvrABC nuclease subunit
MKRLTDIGFRKVGEWQIVNGAITPNLTDLSNSANILYAFISNGEVLYVGKTTQPLKKRMYGYQNPGPTQNTNIKGNRLILELLSNGKNIEIFALPDDGNHHVGVFHLNLAAGLEDSIISTLKPKWNESGK